MIGAVIAMITGVLLLIRISAGYMDAGLAGLALSWALQFVPQVNWLVRNYTQGKPCDQKMGYMFQSLRVTY
jgi:hypothetical protein